MYWKYLVYITLKLPIFYYIDQYDLMLFFWVQSYLLKRGVHKKRQYQYKLFRSDQCTVFFTYIHLNSRNCGYGLLRTLGLNKGLIKGCCISKTINPPTKCTVLEHFVNLNKLYLLWYWYAPNSNPPVQKWLQMDRMLCRMVWYPVRYPWCIWIGIKQCWGVPKPSLLPKLGK